MTLAGQQIGHYKLLRSVGSGGMGEVYLAEDTRIYRQVAVKVVREGGGPGTENSSIQDAKRSFLREAQAIAILDHPNILPLFDFGEQVVGNSWLVYLVTPFRQEGSLAQWLQQRMNTGQLSLQDVSHIVRQAASALQFAHSHGIIHQDVKPSNFLLRNNPENPDRPDILLADFGVAKLSSNATNASQTIRGTPTYMAPEQWEGHAVPATDQYALAVMTYEMLTGRPPFQGTPMRVMYLHNNTQPDPPSALNPQLPSVLDAVLLRALAKRPEERYPSVSAFAQAFQQALESQGLTSGNTPPFYTSASTIGSNDIRATLAISQQEARTGTLRMLTLPDGREVQVMIPAGSYDGQVLRIPNSADPSTGVLLLHISISGARPRQTLVFPDDGAGTVINGQTVFTERGRRTAGNSDQPPYQTYPAGSEKQRSGSNGSAIEAQRTLRNSGNWGVGGAFPDSRAMNNTPDWANASTAHVPPLPPVPPGGFAGRPAGNTSGNSSARVILLVILALLIIAASGGFIYFALLGNHGTATAQAAATAQAQARISINATGTAEASAVAGAANNATATAITATNNQANATATANAAATSAAGTATGQGNATATAQGNSNATATAAGQGNATATAQAGATATVIAGATATVGAQATATVQTTAQYAGNWLNDNPGTTDITRLIITNTGQTLNVHGYGACHPTDCDWGTSSALFNGEPFTITFVFSNGAPTTQLTITFYGDTNHLKVISQDSAAGTIVNYMHRG